MRLLESISVQWYDVQFIEENVHCLVFGTEGDAFPRRGGRQRIQSEKRFKIKILASPDKVDAGQIHTRQMFSTNKKFLNPGDEMLNNHFGKHWPQMIRLGIMECVND